MLSEKGEENPRLFQPRRVLKWTPSSVPKRSGVKVEPASLIGLITQSGDGVLYL